MGDRWVVEAWVADPTILTATPSYDWKTVYAGPDLQDAIVAAVTAKGEGAGCVRIEWRD